MKTFVSSLAIAFLALSSCGSHDQSQSEVKTSIKRYLSAGLTDINLDPGLGIKEKVYGANIFIDYVSHEATLQIDTCPPGRFCESSAPRYSAKVLSQTTNTCQVTTYIARKDSRPVDGALVELEIIDQSRSTCAKNIFQTKVTLKTSMFSRRTGKELKTVSRFSSREELR